MVVFFVEKKPMVFVTTEMVFHETAEKIDNLMNFLLGHPWNQYT
jgi:hypothetical protein